MVRFNNSGDFLSRTPEYGDCLSPLANQEPIIKKNEVLD
jgi:hypothetical protein